MSGVLMTGFPGFIAGRLVKRLLADDGDSVFYFLVLESFALAARDQCTAIEAEHPSFAGRWQVVTGDITKPELGMPAEAVELIRRDVDTVWHLAAIYDLSVPQAFAYKVNVDGTIHVLDLCETLPNLAALNYISTCYVAGDRSGRVFEDELDVGQDYKNHYESTKAWAEKHVRHRLDTIPTRIFRPAIVVGDSQTGETAKADGPYFVLGLLMKLPSWVPMVHLGQSSATVNLVPVDYVVDCMARLSRDDRALGRTFHLADPRPLSARKIMTSFCEALGRAPVVATVPDRLARVLVNSRRLNKLVGIPKEAFVYFEHPVDFDTSNTTELLKDRRDPCPRFSETLPNLVAYAKSHPELFQRGAR